MLSLHFIKLHLHQNFKFNEKYRANYLFIATYMYHRLWSNQYSDLIYKRR
ncbi:hypothetical protein BN1088_1431134 [Sphingobacterium sp. PM2-P1-29]|nr:hypothetical protein BN1088_1431134 [Sphingobacterium sp. PM2-P1-29]